MNKVLAIKKLCAFLQHNKCISWIHYEIVRSALQITKTHLGSTSASLYSFVDC